MVPTVDMITTMNTITTIIMRRPMSMGQAVGMTITIITMAFSPLNLTIGSLTMSRQSRQVVLSRS